MLPGNIYTYWNANHLNINESSKDSYFVIFESWKFTNISVFYIMGLYSVHRCRFLDNGTVQCTMYIDVVFYIIGLYSVHRWRFKLFTILLNYVDSQGWAKLMQISFAFLSDHCKYLIVVFSIWSVDHADFTVWSVSQ